MASLCEQCVTPKIRSRRFAPYHEFFSDIFLVFGLWQKTKGRCGKTQFYHIYVWISVAKGFR